MKKNIYYLSIIILTAIPIFIKAQTCTCDDIAKFAYSKYSISNSTDVASFFSVFFNMTDEQQQKFIQNTTTQTGLEALTKDMYLNYNNNNATQEKKDEYKKLTKEFKQNQSFTQRNLTQIYSQIVSPDALKTYIDCIKICIPGIRIFVDGNDFDEFVVTVQWTPQNAATLTASGPISVNYPGLRPINNSEIYSGVILKAGYSLQQTYKRKDPFSQANIAISVSGFGQANYDCKVKDKEVLGDIPLGTIIASTLNYDKFLKLYSNNSYNVNKTKWAPCDGRIVSTSNYAQEINDHVPDLRGKF